ncbi:hypothetical protein [Tortoise microvirus 108]|nr:hypothetical protein [Tortoise microvirus 108]
MEAIKMADIKLIYPVPKDFVEHSERGEPELYNYVCFHGKQVFLRKCRGEYEVLTASWNPQGMTFDESAFMKVMGYHRIWHGHSMEAAFMCFKKLLTELISVEFDLFDFSSIEVEK